jgi:hypothetical protein
MASNNRRLDSLPVHVHPSSISDLPEELLSLMAELVDRDDLL